MKKTFRSKIKGNCCGSPFSMYNFRMKKKLTLDRRIINALRKLWSISPERYAILKSAQYYLPGYYVCGHCQKAVHRSETAVDHVQPIVSVEHGFGTWDTYIFNLFHGEMQVLCKPCHKTKTKIESGLRAANRRKRLVD